MFMLRAPAEGPAFQTQLAGTEHGRSQLGRNDIMRPAFNERLRVATLRNTAVMQPLLFFGITQAAERPSTDQQWAAVNVAMFLGNLWRDHLRGGHLIYETGRRLRGDR